MLFNWIKKKPTDIATPIVREVKLKNEYEFMFENCIFSTQRELYCILELEGDLINLLKFRFVQYKYGTPNDEIEHPMQQHGMGLYGMYEIENSQWIEELKKQNETHPKHSEALFNTKKHYIIRFKDVTLEIISNGFDELQFTKTEFNKLMNNQIDFLEE